MEKELLVKIRLDGISNEAAEMSKLTIQIKNMKTEIRELEKAMTSGIASRDQILRHASLTKELNAQSDALKNLKRITDTADDSLARMRAELIEMKKKAHEGSQALNAEITPAINKLTADISKLEQAQGIFSRNVGNYPKLMGEMASSFGNLGGEIGSATTSIIASTGPIGILVSIVGALAVAWKKSEENVKLYLESSDKLQYGEAGFNRDAEAARIDLRKRANGLITEGFRLEKENMAKLSTFSVFYNEEQKKHFALLVQQGRQMQEDGRQMRSQVTGMKDKVDWQINYNKLLQEQEKINDERLAKETAWEKLESELTEQRAIVSDMNASVADQIKASVEADRISKELAEEKTAFVERQLTNVKAIAEMTQKQEVYEDRINELLKEKNTIQKEYYSDLIKVNRLESKANKKAGSSKGSNDPASPDFEGFIGSVSKEVEKYQAPLPGDDIFGEIEAKQKMQAQEQRIWETGMEQARQNFRANQDLMKTQAEENLQRELDELDAAKEIADAKIAVGASVADALFAIAGKNRAISYTALMIEKASAIAQIVSNTAIANAKARAMFPMSLGEPWASINTAIAAATIARVIAETNHSAKEINSAGKEMNSTGKTKYFEGGKIVGGIPVYTGTKDNLLVAVNNEEAVINRVQIARLGGSGAMRAAGVPGFERGGAAGPMSYIPPVVWPSNMQFEKMLNAFNNRIDRLEVYNDIHKVRQSLNEVEAIQRTQKI